MADTSALHSGRGDGPSDVPHELNPALAPASVAATGLAGGRGVALALGAVAAAALLASLLLWQKVSNMQEQLARQSAHAQELSQEAQALAKQSLTLAQETVTRVAVMDVRVSEVALQRSQLDALMQSLSRSRDDNLAVDIEAALRLAQQQAELTGTVAPLLGALQSAERRVTRAAQPSLALLQRALARDIDRVKTSAVSDTPSMLVKLDELIRLSDQWVLSQAVGVQRTPAPGKDAAPPGVGDPWQAGWQRIVQEVRQLVRVSQVASPEAVLLSPEQAFFVRENLKLKLLNARIGLLSRQTEAVRADLTDVEEALQKYFDTRHRSARLALGLLQQVQQQTRQLQVPRVDDTLAVLNTLTAGRW